MALPMLRVTSSVEVDKVAENGTRLDAAQRDSMLQRLLASEQFLDKLTQSFILKFFFSHGVDRPISTDESGDRTS